MEMPLAEVAELERRIRSIEDELALGRLINTYHKTADAFDWRGWSECFSENAIFVNQFGPHHGRKEIRELCAKRFGKAFKVFQHIIVNLLFQVSGDSATGSGNLIFVGMRDENKKSNYFLGGGRYEWQFIRTAEGWKIEHGDLTFLWDNTSSSS